MMLCFCNLVDPIIVQLFDEQGKKIAEKFGEKKAEREDLLLEISEVLDAGKVSPWAIQKIMMVPGFGRFSATRTACVVANTLARETGADIFPIDADQFSQKNYDFSSFSPEIISPQKKVDPLFAGEFRGEISKNS